MASIHSIFNDIELEIIKTVKSAVIDAVADTAKEMEPDYKENVLDRSVQHYYDEYDPIRYKKRSEDIYNAFSVDIWSDGSKIKGRYEWDDDKLNQQKSNSKHHQSGGAWISRFDASFEDDGDNGMPEKNWIFGNFLAGKHPIYLFKDGVVSDRSVYTSQFEHNRAKYHNAYYKRLAIMLVKNIKSQCAKYF